MKAADLFLKRLEETNSNFNGVVKSIAEWILTDKNNEGSEHAVVDDGFTKILLDSLGYDKDDYTYNAGKDGNIPDYKVYDKDRQLIFCVEDKSLGKNIAIFKKNNIYDQVKKYLHISPYVILTNAKQIGVYSLKEKEVFAEIFVDIEAILAKKLFYEEQKERLEHFFSRFNKQEFENSFNILRQIALKEEEWKKHTKDISDDAVLDSFIEQAEQILHRLKTEALSQIYNNVEIYKDYKETYIEYKRKFLENYKMYLPSVKEYIEYSDPSKFINSISFEAFKETLQQIDLTSKKVVKHRRKSIEKLSIAVKNFAKLEYELRKKYRNSIDVVESLRNWVEKNKIFAPEKENKFLQSLCDTNSDKECRAIIAQFASEVAYSFFMKLFIIRVLEDKGAFKIKGFNRILTDGGLKLWLEISEKLDKFYGEKSIRTKMLIEEADKLAISVFQDFENKFHYYEWFFPKDNLIIKLLKLFSNYNFKNIRKDIIGYTWEKFKIAKERHKKGQYLTPVSIVKKILDETKYKSDNKYIITGKIIDPACGSGTFLIEAMQRLRKAIDIQDKSKSKKERSLKFIEKCQENIFGMEIDSFSWYLATMNIYLMLMDEIMYLVEQGIDVNIKHINIFHTDALNGYDGNELLPIGDDFKKKMKENFDYVVGNPPYNNAKKEGYMDIDVIRKNEFYRNWFEGDINLYVPFIRVGEYLLKRQGTIGYIHPLTLWADKQTKEARKKILECFEPLYFLRFYAHKKGAVFKDVLQDVGISIFRKKGGIKNKEDSFAKVKVEGTQDRQSLERGKIGCTYIDRKEIYALENFRVYPEKELYEIENRVYKLPHTFLELLMKMGYDKKDIESGKIFYQGTVNANYIWKKFKLHIPESEENRYTKKIALYKGSSVFYLSPLPDEPKDYQKTSSGIFFRYIKVPKSNDFAIHNKLLRIWNNEEEFWSVGFLATYDNNMYRGIRAFVNKNDLYVKRAFTHATYVFETATKCNTFLIAGILSSSLFGMIYGMRETNQNISKNSLLNLPIPSLSPPREISVCAYKAFKQGGDYLRLLEDFGLTRNSNSGIVDILDKTWRNVDRDKIYKIFKYDIWFTKKFAPSYQTTLKEYIDIGDISVGKTKKTTLSTLFSKNSDIEKMLELLKHSYGDKNTIDHFLSLHVPQMIFLHEANEQYENFIDEIEKMGKNFGACIKNIDNAVIAWYNLEKYKATIEKGLPWWNK